MCFDHQQITITSNSRIFIFLLLSHSSVALAECFGSLSCWKVNRPNFSFLAEGSRFSSWTFLYLAPSFSLLSWQVPQSLLMRNIPITRFCHHHASQSGWCSLGDVPCWAWAKCNILHWGQKVPSWFRQTTKHLPHGFRICSGFLHTSNGTQGRLFWVMASFFPPYRTARPDLWSA